MIIINKNNINNNNDNEVNIWQLRLVLKLWSTFYIFCIVIKWLIFTRILKFKKKILKCPVNYVELCFNKLCTLLIIGYY